jgi:hypothetical protein
MAAEQVRKGLIAGDSRSSRKLELALKKKELAMATEARLKADLEELNAQDDDDQKSSSSTESQSTERLARAGLATREVSDNDNKEQFHNTEQALPKSGNAGSPRPKGHQPVNPSAEEPIRMTTSSAT